MYQFFLTHPVDKSQNSCQHCALEIKKLFITKCRFAHVFIVLQLIFLIANYTRLAIEKLAYQA